MKLKIILMYILQIIIMQFFYCCWISECFKNVSSFFGFGAENTVSDTGYNNKEIEEENNIKVTNCYISIKKREEGNNYNIYISKKVESLRISFTNIKGEKQENIFTNWGARGINPTIIENGALCTTIKKTLFKSKKEGEYSFCIKSVDDVEIEDIVVVFYVDNIDDKAIRFRIQKNKITPLKTEEQKIEECDEQKKKEEQKIVEGDEQEKIKEEKKEEGKNNIKTDVLNVQESDKKNNTDISNVINDQIIQDINLNAQLNLDNNISSLSNSMNNVKYYSTNMCLTSSYDSANIRLTNSYNSKSIHSSASTSVIEETFKDLEGNIKYVHDKIVIVNNDSKYKILKDKLQIWFENTNGDIICQNKENAIFKNRGDEITSGMYTKSIKNGFLKNDYDFAFTKIKNKGKDIKEIKIKITCAGINYAIYVVDKDGKDVIQI